MAITHLKNRRAATKRADRIRDMYSMRFHSCVAMLKLINYIAMETTRYMAISHAHRIKYNLQ
jgi:hypothetical protein